MLFVCGCVETAEVDSIQQPFPGILCNWQVMEDIVRLGESSQFETDRMPAEVDCDFVTDCVDDQHPISTQAATARRVSDVGRGSDSARSSSAPSRSVGAPPHKVRGPNWTEQEMLILLAKSVLSGMADIIVINHLLPSLCMAPRHGGLSWLVAWV